MVFTLEVPIVCHVVRKEKIVKIVHFDKKKIRDFKVYYMEVYIGVSKGYLNKKKKKKIIF